MSFPRMAKWKCTKLFISLPLMHKKSPDPPPPGQHPPKTHTGVTPALHPPAALSHNNTLLFLGVSRGGTERRCVWGKHTTPAAPKMTGLWGRVA